MFAVRCKICNRNRFVHVNRHDMFLLVRKCLHNLWDFVVEDLGEYVHFWIFPGYNLRHEDKDIRTVIDDSLDQSSKVSRRVGYICSVAAVQVIGASVDKYNVGFLLVCLGSSLFDRIDRIS